MLPSMTKPSPFADDSRPTRPVPSPPPQEQGTISQEGEYLCPFLGNSVMPVLKKRSMIQAGPEAGNVELGAEAQFWPCQQEKCALWNDEQSDCSIKLGMDALPRLEILLAPLGKHPFFGGGQG